MDIDFIIFWVDGSDVEWQKKKARYKGTEFQNSDVRYRDWDILKYWFRAVENYAPWVHKIYFVSDNQRPVWLNTNHPKLEMVNHSDFIPHKYLPTFQANTIELNLHRIKGLSEYFVVFNDDMYINAPISPEYYFKDGLPCDATLEHVFLGPCYDKDDQWGISIMEFCDIHIVNAHFNRKDSLKNNREKWLGKYLGLKYQLQAFLISLFRRTEFQHFYTPHNEKAFLKEVYKEVWKAEPEMMEKSCSRFREALSLNNYLLRYWQLASNRFYPTKLCGKNVLQLGKDSVECIENYLFDERCKSLCLNDSSNCTQEQFNRLKPKLASLFEKKYPLKSKFEL